MITAATGIFDASSACEWMNKSFESAAIQK